MTCLQRRFANATNGDDRDRTDNLCLARAALSQLSYVPLYRSIYHKYTGLLTGMGVRGLEPRTSALSELRSNHLSYTPRILNVFGGGYFGITGAKCPVIRLVLRDFPSFETNPPRTAVFPALRHSRFLNARSACFPQVNL